MTNEQLDEMEARVRALGRWHPSALREGSDSYEPAEEGEKQELWWECPTCGGEGEIEGQRYDASNVLPATLIAGGIGDGLAVAEWWAEHSPQAILSLVKEVRRLREALLKLSNEAHGFLSMADPSAHGVTNMNVLRLRIDEARAALKEEPGHE